MEASGRSSYTNINPNACSLFCPSPVYCYKTAVKSNQSKVAKNKSKLCKTIKNKAAFFFVLISFCQVMIESKVLPPAYRIKFVEGVGSYSREYFTNFT